MLIDMVVPTHEEDGREVDPAALAQALAAAGAQAAVLVAREAPSLDGPAAGALREAGITPLSAAKVDAGDASFLVLHPKGAPLPAVPGATPNEAATAFHAAGALVLLFNPYAREVRGGTLRDRAVYLGKVDGLVTFDATATLQERLLALELATVRNLASVAGSRVGPEHKDFGRFLTLLPGPPDSAEAICAAISERRCMVTETAQGRFEPVESARHPDGDRPRRPRRDGGRRDERGRGRERDRGRRRR